MSDLIRLLVLGCSCVTLLAIDPPVFAPLQPDLLRAGGSFSNAVADIDGDGDVELFVGFGGSPNRLYRNDAGVLTDVAAAAGVNDVRPTRAAAWGDFDADGDPDLLVGFAPGVGSTIVLYENRGASFVDVTAQTGLTVTGGAVRQPVWLDFDGDDDLDLFVAFRDRANAMYRNDQGRFTDIAPLVGLADPRRSVGASWADLDADGDLDLVVANQDGDANGVFRNDGTRFTDVADSVGVAWGGRAPRVTTAGTVRPCIDDVNRDGQLDLFFANYGPNGLFLRDGSRYRDVSAEWGIAIDGRYDACAFADVDHDGQLDLYVNGTVTGGRNYPDYLFVQAAGRLRDDTPPALRSLKADHGVLWFDVDGDGALDLSLTGVEPDGMHAVLRNRTPPAAARAIQVRVLDGRGRSTRAGAEVRVYRAGTRELLGVRVVDAGSGYNSQSDQAVHIGVGQTTRVDIEAIWPSRGQRRLARRANVMIASTGATRVELRLAAGQPTGR
jgi:penicillin G amidase